MSRVNCWCSICEGCLRSFRWDLCNHVTFTMYRIPSTGIYTNTEHKGLHAGLMVHTLSTQQGSLLSLLCSLLTSQIHTFGCVKQLECDRTTLRVKRSVRLTWAELGGGHIWNWSAPVKQENRCYSFTLSWLPSIICPGRSQAEMFAILLHTSVTPLCWGLFSLISPLVFFSSWNVFSSPRVGFSKRHALSLA